MEKFWVNESNVLTYRRACQAYGTVLPGREFGAPIVLFFAVINSNCLLRIMTYKSL